MSITALTVAATRLGRGLSRTARRVGLLPPTPLEELDRLPRLAEPKALGRLARRDAVSPAGRSLVIAHVDAGARSVARRLGTAVADLEATCRRDLDAPLPDAFDAGGVVRRFEGLEAPTILRRLRTDLPSRRAEARRAFIELTAFRRERGVDGRPVREPWPILVILLAALAMITGEAFLNGAFFRDVAAGGLLEGWIVAGCFAAANVTLSGLVGAWLLRYALNGGSWDVRLVAWIGVLVGVGVLAFLHLSLVSLRVAAVEAGFLGEAARQALDLVAQDPLHWRHDLASIGLLGLGVAISVLGVLKGARAVGDPIPGLGARHRAHVEAVLSCEGLAEDAHDDIVDAADEAQREILSAREPLRRLDARLSMREADVAALTAGLQSWPGRAEALLASAEAIRRDEILALEAASPYPAPDLGAGTATAGEALPEAARSAEAAAAQLHARLAARRADIAARLVEIDVAGAVARVEQARDDALAELATFVAGAPPAYPRTASSRQARTEDADAAVSRVYVMSPGE
ncbi:hypothetical protein [Albimonas pacifica]|uniref:Uncharacterized protein n=1 Tax=Albimonas pacifica TaxID=1114924 RepID=A0A1I3QEI0_9RHOB|nr:hypothetical protein [Albimonas pacifica]SFJ31526.1 hypothetical protein SAMN05216258_1362 [Albimonas pacifica]